ncbi:hypothetical protein AR687_07700 [Flavobacteriaceae bacterium CRH]|nr:hypothetical protein AR687_07700 [Flavobacteriaceae bacterium CRH]
MIKNYYTPFRIILILGFLFHIAVSQIWGREYARYYMYLLILIMIPFLIFELVKQRREDKATGTQNFKLSMYSILITVVIVGILFFLINSNYPSAF